MREMMSAISVTGWLNLLMYTMKATMTPYPIVPSMMNTEPAMQTTT